MRRWCWILGGLSLFGCIANERDLTEEGMLDVVEGSSDPEEVSGSVSLALMQAPAGVRCIRAQIAGATSGDRRKAIVGGASSVIDFGRLNVGPTTFNVSAYNVPCPSGTTAFTTDPSWVSESVTVQLRPGEPSTVSISLYPATNTQVGVDFRKRFVQAFAVGNGTYLRFADDSLGIYGALQAQGHDYGSVRSLTGNAESLVALRTNGTVVYTGSFSYGYQGSEYAAVPTLMPALPASSQTVWAGYSGGCARIDTGDVYCWGLNDWQQFGPLQEFLYEATNVPELFAAQKIVLGTNHVCAITSDARVTCGGANFSGQLGNGWGSYYSGFAVVPSLTAVVDLATNDLTTCSVRADGQVSCWGDAAWGVLGDGSTAARSIPSLVALPGRAVQVTAGETHFCARLDTGEVYCWGGNSVGQLGDGTGIQQNTPQRVLGLEGVKDVTAGTRHSCATLQDNGLFCWGDNSHKQLQQSGRMSFVPVEFKY